jgi:cytochrome c556
MKAKLLVSLIAIFTAVLAGESMAQTNPNQLVAQRKGAMNLQAKYFGPLLAMAQGRAPYDAKIAQRNLEYLTVISQLPWDDFQPSTVGNANTRAKEEIFKDAAKFKSTQETYVAALQKLIASKGSEAALKSDAPTVARSCNSCHEQFSTFNFRFKVD